MKTAKRKLLSFILMLTMCFQLFSGAAMAAEVEGNTSAELSADVKEAVSDEETEGTSSEKTEGSVAEESVTEGSVAEGSVTEGSVAEGSVTEETETTVTEEMETTAAEEMETTAAQETETTAAEDEISIETEDNPTGESETVLEEETETVISVMSDSPFESFQDISVGEELTADITTSGTYAYYRFVPEHTHSYDFSSNTSSDTYGYLYDSEGVLLDSDDDSGEGRNFKITCELTAGEVYYFGARFYFTSYTGSFPVSLTYGDGGHIYGDNKLCTVCGAESPYGKWFSYDESIEYCLDEDGTLKIRGTGEMRNFSDPDSVPWLTYDVKPKAVIIEEGVTSIGAYAFYNCTSLTSIVIPDSVVKIGDYAFYSCTGIGPSFTIPGNCKEVGNYAFAYCTGLSSVSIQEGVTTLGDAVFTFCNQLIHLTLPQSLTAVGNNVLLGCNSELEISGNTSLKDQISAATALASNNKNDQNYSRWSYPVKSYLFKNADDTLTRVEYADDMITVEQYTKDGVYIGRKLIAMELPIWGGFYAGSEYNYFVFGQTNYGESNAVEVVRIVKYTKDWKRVDGVGIYGANTYIPFDAGSLRITESGSMLYIRTCHEMYLSWDGYHHQANMTFVVDTSSMTVTYVNSNVSNVSTGYVSHSFNQFITTDGTNIMAVDHGDAYPRSIVLIRYANCAGSSTLSSINYVSVLPILGSTGANDTGVSIGGFEVSKDAYLVAGNSVAQDDAENYNPGGVRNIFVTSTQIDDFSSSGTSIHWLTDYASGTSVSTPHMVKLNETRFLLMWTVNGVVNYVLLDENGNAISTIHQNESLAVSDCKPIVVDGKVTWYATKNSVPVFYSIDPENLENSGNGYTNISACTISLSDSIYLYDGTAKEPTVTVKNGNSVLKQGQDYTVTYSNNVNAGTASVTITGIGSYTGTVTKTFTIHMDKQTVIASGYSGSTVWKLTYGGELSFSGTGAMRNYTGNTAMPWYDYRDQITSVVIEDGVTTIGAFAFYGMPNLISVTIPESVVTIGTYAFKGCTALDGVVLPAALTTLGESAFYGCTSLTAIEIPASLYTVKPYTFKNCTSLEEVTFHEGNLMKLSDGAFYGTALKEVTFPTCLDIIDVYCFKNCSELASVTIPKGDLTQIREAVFYGTAISELNIPEGVTKVGSYAFKNCSRLKSVSLPGTLTDVGEAAFYSCTGLTSAAIPDKVTSIGNYAFRNCIGLTSVTFGKGLKTIGESSFYGDTKLTELNLPAGVTDIGAYAFKSCTGLTNVSLPASLKTIGDSAFYSCTVLPEITIPANVTVIGAYCFSKDSALKTIRFEGNAPAIGTAAFRSVTGNAYYPKGNTTWTDAVKQNYGGTLTWRAVD